METKNCNKNVTEENVMKNNSETFKYKEKSKDRNSSIELLKIIGMMLIVLCHSVPFYGKTDALNYVDLTLATKNISEFIFIVFRNIGQIGNIIFVMCSAYFLVNSNATKTKKILYIISDCFVISILHLIIYLLIGIDISTKDIIKQILPITFSNNWFIGCYLLLYIIHPFLNKIINTTEKKNLLRINIFLIVIYCILCKILGTRYYYSNLIVFITIYFIVAYNKLYLKKFAKNFKQNVCILVLSILAFLFLLIITNILGLRIGFLSNKMLYWNSINNIFFILIGLTLLNLFSRVNYKNKIINYVSSLSLLFYVIHENALFRYYIKPIFYQIVFPYGNRVLWVCIESILLFVYGIVLASIYKETLQKLVYKISDKILKVLCSFWDRVEKIMLKVN